MQPWRTSALSQQQTSTPAVLSPIRQTANVKTLNVVVNDRASLSVSSSQSLPPLETEYGINLAQILIAARSGASTRVYPCRRSSKPSPPSSKNPDAGSGTAGGGV